MCTFLLFSSNGITSYCDLKHKGYSIGAIASTAHDAFVILALFSYMLHGVVHLAMEADSTFIAAILTVIGYSLNDTAIIFDRLREYLNLNQMRI